jgi:hypothetical protein
VDPQSVEALLGETCALAVCLRFARRLYLCSLAAAEPFLESDNLHNLVGTLLAKLRDTPTGDSENP